ncbi:DUF2625 domain-containing protein [Rufibacter psychrotolerans]|uniref:DUF2625 domain-containing protein n=1 Tax=Rufibacter psychrotolerans TaxID=2812556 RepID=UPI001967F70A|nr:DUF2625 domain-containing protein [Rufibacter sp. SYSU D00308]
MKHLLCYALLFISLQGFAQTLPKRTLKELVTVKEPGWDLVSAWVKRAKNKVEVLPKTQASAEAALLQAQVTTRSPMGAVIYETGGILVDDGWIRILGSGSSRLPRSLMAWNKGKSYLQEGTQPSFLLIADDVLGGFFAINAGAISETQIGKIFYLSPDTLQWEPTELGYSEFLQFCFSANLAGFYAGMRWKGWEADVKKLAGDRGIHCYPYLWTSEGKDINKVSRKDVPIEELWLLYSGQKK